MKRVVDPSKLFYGMNIHPQFCDTPWFRTPAEVIREVHELGCSVARIDCYGLEEHANVVLDHVKEAEARDILVVPCFAFNAPFEADNYDSGFYCGKTSAAILRDHCPIYEVSNEISVYCNGEGPGTDPARYVQAHFVTCRDLIRGLIDGVKSVQPDAKIIIGGGVTTLTAFNKMLWNGTEPNGSGGHPQVRWDYTGWHWYESSGRIDAAYDGTHQPYNVIADLAESFGVPIWITELGFIPDDRDPDRQSAYVDTALAEYREYAAAYGVINLCWYSLYDDGSGTFGLIRVDEDVAATAATVDPKAYARQKTREVEAFLRTSGGGAGIDALSRKPAHATFMRFIAANPDDGHGGGDGDFHTAEYTMPIALHDKLRDAAARHGVSENDELVRRLESTFTPVWALYDKLADAAGKNGVSLGEEIATRLASTFA